MTDTHSPSPRAEASKRDPWTAPSIPWVAVTPGAPITCPLLPSQQSVGVLQSCCFAPSHHQLWGLCCWARLGTLQSCTLADQAVSSKARVRRRKGNKFLSRREKVKLNTSFSNQANHSACKFILPTLLLFLRTPREELPANRAAAHTALSSAPAPR